MTSNNPRLVSPVFKIRWAGWESTTYQLQRCGWELSAQEEFHINSVRLALHHPQFRIYGFTSPLPYEDFYDLRRNLPEFGLAPQVFDVQYMASKVIVQVVEDFSTFKPIDTEPQLVTEAKSIEDFKIFRTIGNMPEVIVEPASVPEMLELILKYQSPKQAEIREKRRKEMRRMQEGMIPEAQMEYNPAADYVAQVIALR